MTNEPYTPALFPTTAWNSFFAPLHISATFCNHHRKAISFEECLELKLVCRRQLYRICITLNIRRLMSSSYIYSRNLWRLQNFRCRQRNCFLGFGGTLERHFQQRKYAVSCTELGLSQLSTLKRSKGDIALLSLQTAWQLIQEFTATDPENSTS